MSAAAKKLQTFSCILFLIISLGAGLAYVLAARQINSSYIEQHLSIAAETLKLRLTTETNGELALVMKLGATPVIREYFMNPDDPALEAAALAEFHLFQRHIREEMVFWVSDANKIFYSTDMFTYVIDPDDPEFYWYNMTLYETERYNFNINYNSNMQMIRLWVNAPVFADIDGEKKPVGMIGTGINLTEFAHFVANIHREFDRNVTPYLFNRLNEITSAADFELIAGKVLLRDYLGDAGASVTQVAERLGPDEHRFLIYGGNMYLVSSIPEMDWFLAVSYPLPGLLALNRPINVVFLGMLLLILLLFIVMNIFVSRSENELAKQNVQLREANRKAEQNIRLLEASRKAEQASKAKSNFLATMSHEIRTPMNAIIGIAQIQLQKDNLPDEYASALEKIYNSGSNLLGIINDILDLSKIETGKMELNLAEYEIPRLIQDAVQVNIVRIGTKPIEFILDVDETLPLKLHGDELRLKQILNNLLSNAIKYTERGHVKLSISHFALNDVIKLRFIVEDTGQGMKPKDRKRLFSQYLRFNAENNRVTEGTGIGLSIAKNLIELMEGSIEVESEYGKGSVFTVTVIQKAAGCEAIGAELANQLLNFTFSGDKRYTKMHIHSESMSHGKVLIVDDVEANLDVAEGLMSPYGLEIETAISGFAAIAKVEQRKDDYDIIFMDHMMPLMDGIETAKKLRAMGYKGVIVAFTANAIVGNAEMFKENGFDDFISKPIDYRQLNAVLDKFIRDKCE